MTKLKDLKETSVASTIGIVVHREEEEVDQNGMLAYAYHFQMGWQLKEKIKKSTQKYPHRV